MVAAFALEVFWSWQACLAFQGVGDFWKHGHHTWTGHGRNEQRYDTQHTHTYNDSQVAIMSQGVDQKGFKF
jgi:hypothetical protein